MTDKIIKTDDEWRELLTPEQYRIARKKGTERPFTGEYNDFKGKGLFRCVCCGIPLFSSEAKYNSGSGWPSYREAVAPDRIETDTDRSFGMVRTEIRCARCDAHLGHIFDDGPPPTGKRYCVNSASLRFEPEGDMSAS